MGKREIYNKFRAHGLTHAGACAMGGNIQAESANRSNNVEDRSGMGDAQYTAMVDAGGYDFATDNGKHYGYGLCQWTLKSRKVELLRYAKNRGVSIADEDMQVDFAVHELKRDFSGLWKFLCSTDDMYTATDRICREFENPAVKNTDIRYEFAQEWDREFGDGETSVEIPTVSQPTQNSSRKPSESILVLEAVLNANGYAIPASGFATKEFCDMLEQFAKDVRKAWGF